jgi:hypothetical protein
MTNISWLMLFREMIAIYSENNKKNINLIIFRRESAKILKVELAGRKNSMLLIKAKKCVH